MSGTMAIGLCVTLATAACASTGGATCRPKGTELRLVADDHHFSSDCLAAPADQAFTIAFRNEDTSPHGVHNVEILDGAAVFTGESLKPGGTSIVYEVQPLPAGIYAFRCTNHGFMRGTFVVA